jgi:hypothetical protein
MSFTNPIWLWGLTGLIVPVAVHLLSLKEGRIVYIGSLRHLRESNTAQFSSIRLNEILLLFLRSLLIILLVLFLSGFHFDFGKNTSGKWVVVDREVFENQAARILVDSLQQNGYEVRLFNHGFPPVSDSTRVESKKNNWILARELAGKNLKDAIVITHNFAADYRGVRESKPEQLKWISVEPSERTFEVEKIAISDDSLWSRVAESTSKMTTFSSRFLLTSGNSFVDKPINILLYADAGFENDAKVLLASLRSIDVVVPFTIEVTRKKIDRSKLSPSDWIIWLSREKLDLEHPNVIAFSLCRMKNLTAIEQSIKANLSCDVCNNRWWTITKRLTQDIALTENLSIKLASILIGKPDPETVSGQRTLSEESIWSPAEPTRLKTASAGDAENEILVLLVVLTLIIERLVAFNRKQ